MKDGIPLPVYGKVVVNEGGDGPKADCIRVDWGLHKNIYSEVDLISGELITAEEFNEKFLVPEVPAEINTAELDKLILSPDKKRSIISVLKQHVHAKKLFETWGLGEVMEYGRGMTMLFHGPPGCGKTWGANCIAKAMGKELIMKSNADLQSSTPGEMERNIQKAFQAAKTQKCVLFFDECDSLLMTRANVGMILGSEINCLLTEIEKFEGICILATNRIGELDEALERRISLIIKFPKPSQETRSKIWERFLPKKLPLAKDVDQQVLSTYELTGGLIKNVVLNAARQAVAEDREEVSMQDFQDAVKNVARGTKAFETESVAPSPHGIMRAINKATANPGESTLN